MKMTDSLHLLSLCASISLAACVKAPNVSIVDSKTALEKQAAGDYPALENDLEQAGIQPRSEVFPREQLGTNGDSTAALGEIAQLYAAAETDEDAIDRLLISQCIGEALSGFLEPRPSDCTANVDTAEMTRLLGRENLHRRQIWQLAASERGAEVAQAQHAWRTIHLKRIVCKGLIQIDAQVWKAKEC